MKTACKTRCKKVCTKYAQDGTKRCRACRAYDRAIVNRYRAKNPEKVKEWDRAARKRYYLRYPDKVRAKRRAYITRYLASNTAKARAYIRRSKAANRASCAAWTARNPIQKDLLRRFNNAVRSGDITKPLVCADCRKPKSPLVGWNIHEDTDGVPTCEAFCCWGCWWKRKRAE